MPDIEKPAATPLDPKTIDGAMEILKRASLGDKSVQSLVKTLFEQDRKEGWGFLDVYGNSFEHACNALTRHAAGNDCASKEALTRTIRAIRDEIAGPNPSPLERLLCERVALCWFDANETDRRYCDQAGITFKDATYREDRRDRAHKRFLSACKALASVRKLGVPAIQVNLANQQVHVSGSA